METNVDSGRLASKLDTEKVLQLTDARASNLQLDLLIKSNATPEPSLPRSVELHYWLHPISFVFRQCGVPGRSTRRSE